MGGNKTALRLIPRLTLPGAAKAEVLKTCDPLSSSQCSHLRQVSQLKHTLCARQRDKFIQTNAYTHKIPHTHTDETRMRSSYPVCKGKPCPIKGLLYIRRDKLVDLLLTAGDRQRSTVTVNHVTFVETEIVS